MVRIRRGWLRGLLLGSALLVVTPSCRKEPPAGNVSGSSTQVLDDDDYEHLPSPPVTPTPVSPLPTPSPGSTLTPEPLPPTLPPPPEPNVSGTIYAGSTNASPDQPVRLAFYDSTQLTAEDTPRDPEVSVFHYDVFPPFPIEFVTNIPFDREYVAEAWQDLNQNGTIDAGDLVGDSARFYASDQLTTIEITLETVN